MPIDLRLPNITGPTDKERISQMQGYLFQLVEQLQWALQNVDTTNAAVVAPVAKSQLPMGVNTPSDPQATFNSIKSLIIKSADIVTAYYDEISRRLEGLYVAESDFGTFKQETSQTIEENSTGVSTAFTNIQTIEKNLATSAKELGDAIDEVNRSISEVNATIKTGLLYYDGETPVYGFEVGQTNVINGVETFNKFARFTAGRLSFYDRNGTEVAYISDYKLYITHAEVTGTLKIGGYLVDTTKGLTFKWVGRS